MISASGAAPAGYDLGNDQDREDRRKHLELVSNVIARMSSSSAVAKGWCVSIGAAAFGVALIRDNLFILVVGVVLAASFGVLDIFYLSTEKRYRDLYRAIVEDNSVEPFSMKAPPVARGTGNRSYLSWSVLFFYIPLIVALVLCVVVSQASRADAKQEEHDCALAEEDTDGRTNDPLDRDSDACG